MDIDDIDVDSPEQRMAMRRRHASIGRLAQEIALAGLLELKAKLAAGQPLNLTYEEAGKLRGAGLEMEREALGRRQLEAGDADDVTLDPRKPN